MGGEGIHQPANSLPRPAPPCKLPPAEFRLGRESWRLASCPRCRAQMRLCSDCDRAHVYCSKACASSARRESVADAGRRYAASERGRANNRARQARFRARVTHHSSPSAPPERETPAADETVSGVAATAGFEDPPGGGDAKPNGLPSSDEALRCTICGRPLPRRARRGFLRPPRRRFFRGARPRLLWPRLG